jgi:malate permease and related proteins
MIVSAFVEVLLPVLVVVACGCALRRVFPIDLRSLNRISMYVLSPAAAAGSGRPIRAAALVAE